MSTREIHKLADHLKHGFDRSVTALDGETVSRIARVRHLALKQPGKKPWSASAPPMYWLPAGAVLAACFAVILYGLVPRQSLEEKAFIDEVEMISELEFYENLEFYEWLEQHELPS